MRSMQWQLGILGTISAFAFRHRETKKNLCRGGRSQDLATADFQQGRTQPEISFSKTRRVCRKQICRDCWLQVGAHAEGSFVVLLGQRASATCSAALTAALRKFRPIAALKQDMKFHSSKCPNVNIQISPQPTSSSPEPKQLITSQHLSLCPPHFCSKVERTAPAKPRSHVFISFSVINEAVLTSPTLPRCLYYLSALSFVFVYPFTLCCVNTARHGRGTVTHNACGQSPPHRK